MNRKSLSLALAVATLLGVGGQAIARHVTHPVTPKNIDKQPFAFTVAVKDMGKVKEFRIVVKRKAGHPAPVASATGKVVIARSGKKEATFPAVTRLDDRGAQTYTFRIAPSDLNRAQFTFTETPDDPRIAFPAPGDYWVFDLGDFAGGSRK